MPNIKLPDGSIRSFEQSVTIAEVAASIGAGLARAALAGKVNGKLVDTSFCIDEDVDLAIITDKDTDGLDIVLLADCPNTKFHCSILLHSYALYLMPIP